MSRYDQDWADSLCAQLEEAPSIARLDRDLRLLYVIAATADGKRAFHVDFSDGRVVATTAGKLPRGETPDVTITIDETVLIDFWTGKLTRDVAYMAGDVKVEGLYEVWLDVLVPAFEEETWAQAWSKAV